LDGVHNGSGKSALLKAIAIGLVGRDAARSLQPSFHRWIRHGAGEDAASIQLEIVRREEDDTLVEQGRAPASSFPARLELKNGSKEATLVSCIPPGKQKSYQTPERTIWATDARVGSRAATVRSGASLAPPRKQRG
jgi:hypothetical protein